MPKILIAALASILIVFAAFRYFSTSDDPSAKTATSPYPETEQVVPTVREENGTQIIRILARGGYSPDTVSAKSGIPTIVEVETKGTYDCSSAFTIPSLKYEEQLPATGITKIDIGSREKGTELLATCSMGMYSFTMNFE